MSKTSEKLIREILTELGRPNPPSDDMMDKIGRYLVLSVSALHGKYANTVNGIESPSDAEEEMDDNWSNSFAITYEEAENLRKIIDIFLSGKEIKETKFGE